MRKLICFYSTKMVHLLSISIQGVQQKNISKAAREYIHEVLTLLHNIVSGTEIHGIVHIRQHNGDTVISTYSTLYVYLSTLWNLHNIHECFHKMHTLDHLKKSSIGVCTDILHVCAHCKLTIVLIWVPDFVDNFLKSRNVWMSSIADTKKLKEATSLCELSHHLVIV